MKPRVLLILPMNGGALTVGVHLADALSVTAGVETSIVATQPLFDLYQTSFGHMDDLTDRNRTILKHINLAAMGRLVEFKPDLVLVMALCPISPWFIDAAKSLGAVTAHWYVENFRYAPSNPLIPPWQIIAPCYDHFFAIQKGAFFAALREKGARNYHYLPTACNPRIHQKLGEPDREYLSDIAFVGSVYPNRVTLFKELKVLDLALWGPGWAEIPELKPCARGSGAWITSPEETRILNSARIGLNIHSSLHSQALIQKGDFLNPRVFSIAACGTFQLLDEQGPLHETFEKGAEVATYEDPEELCLKAKFYIENPGEREKFAARALERVLDEHTYAHRIRKMLSLISLN